MGKAVTPSQDLPGWCIQREL